MPVQAVRLVDDLTQYDATLSRPTRARSLPTCPICRDTMVAAEASALLAGNSVQHLWSCGTCGCGFVTERKIVCHQETVPKSPSADLIRGLHRISGKFWPWS